MPERPYEGRNNGFDPSLVEVPFVYEAHVGMGGEEGRVHTYREFADEVLPRISRLGYNTVQLMAVQEHPYYCLLYTSARVLTPIVDWAPFPGATRIPFSGICL